MPVVMEPIVKGASEAIEVVPDELEECEEPPVDEAGAELIL